MCKEQGNVSRMERGGEPSGERAGEPAGQGTAFGDERTGVSEAGQIPQRKGSPKHKDTGGKKSPPLHSGLDPSSARGPVCGLLPALASGKQLA